MSQAGIFKHIIEIHKPVMVKTEYASLEKRFQLSCCTRARIIYNNGNADNVDNENINIYLRQFVVRSYIKICEEDQIHYKGRKYKILSINEREDYNDILINTEIINE